MAHYVIFTKVVTLTMTFIRFQKKKIWVVFELEYIICQKIRTIGPVVWPVHREQTDKQTDRQTRRQTDRQTDRQMKGHSESAYFAKLDL